MQIKCTACNGRNNWLAKRCIYCGSSTGKVKRIATFAGIGAVVLQGTWVMLGALNL